MPFSVQHTGDRYNMIQHASFSCMNMLQYVTVFHFNLNNNLLNINNYNYNRWFLMFVERWLKRKKFEFGSCQWQKYWWFVAFRGKKNTKTSSSGHPFVFQYKDHSQNDMLHCTWVFTSTSLAWNSGFREYWKVADVHRQCSRNPQWWIHDFRIYIDITRMIMIYKLSYLCMFMYTCTIHIYIYTYVSICVMFVYHHVTKFKFFNKQSRKSNLF